MGEVFGHLHPRRSVRYPVAILLMGKSAGDIAFYAYIVPFLVSTPRCHHCRRTAGRTSRAGALRAMQASLS